MDRAVSQMKSQPKCLFRFVLGFTVAFVSTTLAFIVPGGEPTTLIVGKVLSTEKVGDYGRDKIIHWELWKAEVKVERAIDHKFGQMGGPDTNIADKVVLYYSQDWSTNFVDINGMHPETPPRLRLALNQSYEFLCHNHANLQIDFGIDANTNALLVLGGGIKPK
jgi:hypothetical protein